VIFIRGIRLGVGFACLSGLLYMYVIIKTMSVRTEADFACYCIVSSRLYRVFFSSAKLSDCILVNLRYRIGKNWLRSTMTIGSSTSGVQPDRGAQPQSGNGLC
jgi:hypothetical protein